jgi:hypothetical protein
MAAIAALIEEVPDLGRQLQFGRRRLNRNFGPHQLESPKHNYSRNHDVPQLPHPDNFDALNGKQLYFRTVLQCTSARVIGQPLPH